MSKQAYQFLTDFINHADYETVAEDAHNAWLEIKTSQGWRYGRRRNARKKRHPLMKAFNQLPAQARSINNLTPYAVANFFRTNFGEYSFAEFTQLLRQLLEGQHPATMQQLSEYVHSHFIATQFAQGETPKSRKDMIVYEDLDADTKSWDTHIALEVVRQLIIRLENE
jgi:hypothetical protein